MMILKNRRKKIYGEWDGNPLSFKTLKKLIPNLDKEDLDKLVEKEILVQEQDGRYELYHTKNSAGIDGIYRVFLPQSEIFSTITATENRDFIATTSILGKNPEEYKMKFIKSIFLKRQFSLITGREAARLQGFPETFKIHKNEKIAKKQFGNAVPVNVVQKVATELLKYKVLN
jgi:DNA (cytosine-5)-methyltransferase 1